MTPPTTDPRVHAYLDAVRRSLSGTDPKHAETIVADLESHILDAVGDLHNIILTRKPDGPTNGGNPIPEPMSMGLLATGLLGGAITRRKLKKI